MKRYTDLNGILGEFQFAFVSFVVGHVYDAFENWKHLLNLLCSCDDALNMHHEIFNKFISTLHFQLKQLPKDFFVDIISKTNFLTQSLQSFFLNLKLSDAPQDLKEKGGRFCIHLTKKFKWDFDGEPDEEAPVVVDM